MNQTLFLRTTSIVLDSFKHISEIRSVSVIRYKPYGLLNPLETQNRGNVAVKSTLATGWTSQGSNPGRGKRGFPSSDRPNRLCGLSNFQFMVYQGSSLQVKRPSAKVKNEWSYTSVPSTWFYLGNTI